jgi:hypothetical protein
VIFSRLKVKLRGSKEVEVISRMEMGKGREVGYMIY